MPLVEILDGPPEWAGVVYETDEDVVADEIGCFLPAGAVPRWGWVGGALYAYRKVEVVGERHRYRYLGPWGSWHWSRRRRHDGVEDLTGWDVPVVQQEPHSEDRHKLWGSPVRALTAPPAPGPARPGRLRSRAGRR